MVQRLLLRLHNKRLHRLAQLVHVLGQKRLHVLAQPLQLRLAEAVLRLQLQHHLACQNAIGDVDGNFLGGATSA